MLARPDYNDVLDGEPLTGATGRLFSRHLIQEHGYTRSDVLVAGALRCAGHQEQYLTGPTRPAAERWCRQYDTALDLWGPTHYLITLDLKTVNKTWSLLRVIQAETGKAFRLAAQNPSWKVLVLLGAVPMAMLLPDLQGGLNKWHGNYGRWNWLDIKRRLNA